MDAPPLKGKGEPTITINSVQKNFYFFGMFTNFWSKLFGDIKVRW